MKVNLNEAGYQGGNAVQLVFAGSNQKLL